MRFDYSKLLGKMKEKHLTQRELARIIGVSQATLNLKLRNKDGNHFFNQFEIIKISETLSIATDDVAAFFYAQ